MSSTTPSGPSDGSDHWGATTPEYLGSGAPGSGSARSGQARRWPVLGAAAAGVAAVVALGGWGAFALLSGGAQPAEAVPAGAVAYASLDLDPSASQKIEAFKMLQKFPALEKELGLDTTDDLRRLFFEKMKDETGCHLDYEADIAPWIGERMAVAAVPDDAPGFDAPVFVLQVSDEDGARAGVEAFHDCVGADEGFGFAFSGDYMLVTDTEARALSVAAAAAEASLADDEAFVDWTGQVGDPGILTMYAAPGAPRYFAEMRDDRERAWSGSSEDAGPDRTRVEALSRDFQGMALTVRFEDGAVDAELAGRGLPAGLSSSDGTSGPSLADLPETTGAAFTVGLPEGWLDQWLETMAGEFGSGGSVDRMLAEAEADTGLALPEDLETLLGDGVSLSFDAGTDLEAMFDSPDPSTLKIGLRVAGDPDQIMPVVEKIKAWAGPESDMVVVEPGEGVVVFGLNPDYVQTLLRGGSLGEQETFRRVVPDAEEATAALYVDFDAGSGWAEELAEQLSPVVADPQRPETDPRANVAPLDALGLSTWVDGDLQRGLLRLTTD